MKVTNYLIGVLVSLSIIIAAALTVALLLNLGSRKGR